MRFQVRPESFALDGPSNVLTRSGTTEVDPLSWTSDTS